MSSEADSYTETLRVPVSWWLIGAGGAVAVWWCFFVATPWPLALVAGALVAAGVSAALVAYGSVRVVVGEAGLTAGRARLPWRNVGAVEALDDAATRRVLGPDADARAYLLLRAYCHGSVRVGVDDEDDPAPYWVISTRQPEALAARLSRRAMRD